MTTQWERSLSTGKVARSLGLSNATVQGYARVGRIPAGVTPGKQYRFNLEEVRIALRGDDLPVAELAAVDDAPGVMAYMTTEVSGDRRSAAWAALRGHPEQPAAEDGVGAGGDDVDGLPDDDLSLAGLVGRSPATAVSVLHHP